MYIPKGGVKSGRQYCETVYLMPLRYGLANRKEEHDSIPASWPEKIKEGLQPLPHWRYACRFVRSGWLYIRLNFRYAEFACSENGFVWKQSYDFLGVLTDESNFNEPVSPDKALCIAITDRVEGYITYSEARWDGKRIRELEKDNAYQKRMQPFATNGRAKKMFPLKEIETVVEECREYPGHLVCMGTELACKSDSHYGAFCEHALRNKAHLRIPFDAVAARYNDYRLQYLLPEQQERFCYHPAKQQLHEKFLYHISWHAGEDVSPFHWMWKKQEDKSYTVDKSVREIATLKGQAIVLDDPLGMGRELSALFEHAVLDELHYLESIDYPLSIAKHIKAMSAQETDVSAIFNYLRISPLRQFTKEVESVIKGIEAYYADIVAARKVILLENEQAPNALLMQCMDDWHMDVESREKVLDDIIVGLVHKLTDEGKDLAEKLCFADEENSLLWKCVSHIPSAKQGATEATYTVAMTLWHMLAPTESPEKAEQHMLWQAKWFKALDEREILPMTSCTLKMSHLLSLEDLRAKLFGNEEVWQETPGSSLGKPLYMTEDQRAHINAGTDKVHFPNQRPLAPRDAEPQKKRTSKEGKMRVYIPEVFARNLRDATDPFYAGAGTAVSIKDLQRDSNIRVLLRIVLVLVAADALYRLSMDEEPSGSSVAAARIGALAAFAGIGEWGGRKIELYLKEGSPAQRWTQDINKTLGAAGKLFGGFAGLILSVEAGKNAVTAFQKEEYAKCMQKSMEGLAFGIGGYRFLAVGLWELQTKFAIFEFIGKLTTSLKITGINYLKGLNPYLGALFIGAEVIALYTEMHNPLVQWARSCFWAKRNEHMNADVVCALAPVYAAGLRVQYHPLQEYSPEERLQYEEERLFSGLHQPLVRRVSAKEMLVSLPGFNDNTSSFWLQWQHAIDPYTDRPAVFQSEHEVFELADERKVRKLRIVLRSPHTFFPIEDIGLDYHYFVGESTLFAPERQAASVVLSGSVSGVSKNCHEIRHTTEQGE